MYTIVFKKSVEKDLRKLDATIRTLVVRKIQGLAIDPRPDGFTKLRGERDLYRVRHGDYRVIYQIKDDKLVIKIIKVGHRKDVYRS